tara:strand:+ start:306 stop:1124 length:819 start_codon:yes stop_codon:yes gene_type:complete
MNLQLKKFNMNMIKDDEVVVMIGKRNTGKSFLTKDLMYYKKSIPVGTVISPTENANKFYSDIIPPIFIHDEYQEGIISNFMKRQKHLKKKIRSGDTNIDNRAFLLLDDCLYDNQWKKDKRIREIFMNGRHWNIMFILIMQYALGVPPNLRCNIDWVFILRENIVSNRKRLYDHYAGMFPTFDMFCSTMDQCTNNYECLVIHNSSRSNKLDEQVYWYKANSHDKFKVCTKEAWAYSDNNYIEDDNENNYEETTNIEEYMRSKRKGPELKIKKI